MLETINYKLQLRKWVGLARAEMGDIFMSAVLVCLVAVSMGLIVQQLVLAPLDVRHVLLVKNVLALMVVVGVIAGFMRVGLTGARAGNRRVLGLMIVVHILLFLAAMALAYMVLGGVGVEGYLKPLLTWYALALVAAATVFLIFNYRDYVGYFLLENLMQEAEILRMQKAAFDVGEIIVIKSLGKIEYVAVSQIQMVSAARNYVELHCEHKTYLYRQSMKQMMLRLDKIGFVRVHRSGAVGLKYIREFSRGEGEKSFVLLNNGEKVAVGAKYRRALLEGMERMVLGG